jgi:hypothetical protein
MGQPGFDEFVVYWGPIDDRPKEAPWSGIAEVCQASAVGPVVIVTPVSQLDAVCQRVPGWDGSGHLVAVYRGKKGLNALVKKRARLLCVDAANKDFTYKDVTGAMKGITPLRLGQNAKGWHGVILIGLSEEVFSELREDSLPAVRHEPRSRPKGFELGPPYVPPPGTEEDGTEEYPADVDWEFIGQSSSAADVKQRIALVAREHYPVLVWGEAGTGQKLVARLIHRLARPHEPGRMTSIICAAIAPGRMEAEWCGCVAGACPWAVTGREGAFALSCGGTVYLDDIADLSMGDQAKLVRILTDRRFRLVGGTESVKLEARVIAGTRKNLQARVDAGTFRRDLYDRLNTFPIRTPALRSVPEDIPGIARHLWAQVLAECSHPPDGRVSASQLMGLIDEEVGRLLASVPWPGNARQLHSFLSRVHTLALKDDKSAGIHLVRCALGAEHGAYVDPAEDS